MSRYPRSLTSNLRAAQFPTTFRAAPRRAATKTESRDVDQDHPKEVWARKLRFASGHDGCGMVGGRAAVAAAHQPWPVAHVARSTNDARRRLCSSLSAAAWSCPYALSQDEMRGPGLADLAP